MTFSVPKFDIQIPQVPITNQSILDLVDKCLETYKSIPLNDIDYKEFGTFKLRVARAKFLRALLREFKPKYSLELGSGGSTVFFAMEVESHHVSFEHLDWCYDRTTDELEDLDLDEKATVHLLELDDDTGMYKFDPEKHIPGPIDIYLIDGPPVSPKRKGRPRWERWNTLPFIMPYLSERAIVLLDSTERVFEQECLELWCAEHGIAFMNPGEEGDRLQGLGIIDPWHSKR